MRKMATAEIWIANYLALGILVFNILGKVGAELKVCPFEAHLPSILIEHSKILYIL